MSRGGTQLGGVAVGSPSAPVRQLLFLVRVQAVFTIDDLVDDRLRVEESSGYHSPFDVPIGRICGTVRKFETLYYKLKSASVYNGCNTHATSTIEFMHVIGLERRAINSSRATLNWK